MISRWTTGMAVAGGVVVAGALALASRADEISQPRGSVERIDPSNPETKKKYPFQSIAARLEYEKKREIDKDVKLSEGGKKRLQEMEDQSSWQYRRNGRTYMLYLMHEKEVKEFIGREGFGMMRMPIRPFIINSPETGSIAFAPAPAKEPNVGPAVVLPRDHPKVADGPVPTLPSQSQLDQFHRQGTFNFVNFSGLGLVVDRTRVAGFNAHQFTHMPNLAAFQLVPGKELPKDKWNVRRLELVGLLKHEKPVIYVSENLPRMEELKSAPTRDLAAFERDALKVLRGGEDLVVDSHLNQIRMVGSIRATKTCMKCHEVGRGELLGAFSYLLQRDPPAVEK